MSGERTGFRPALELMKGAAAKPGPVIVAIDGRSGSGKTYLARLAAEELGCPVVHMDDFYLPMDRRVQNWAGVPCANMDLARLRREVLEPFRAGERAAYRPYSCETKAYREPVELPPGDLLLVEGSYCHHPSLADLYDGKIFLTCDAASQRRRLTEREGEYVRAFERVWIPLEEQYVQAFSIGGDCLVIDTSDLF